MNKLATALLFAAIISMAEADKAVDRSFVEDLAVRNLLRGPVQHKRLQKPDHILASEWKGKLKYTTAADAAQDFPEIIMIEDFLTGFIKGASSAYSTSNSTADSTCTTAMSGIVVSFFDLLANREIYNPTKSVKAVIAFKELQENQAVFYAYCDFSHLYSVLAELTSFSDAK